MKRTGFFLALFLVAALAKNIQADFTIKCTAGPGSMSGDLTVSGTITLESGWVPYDAQVQLSVWNDCTCVMEFTTDSMSSGGGNWTFSKTIENLSGNYYVFAEIIRSHPCYESVEMRSAPTTGSAK